MVFPNPQLYKAHNGHLSVELTEEGTWEGSPQFAEQFTKALGATKIKQVDGPDVRFWDLELDGVRLNLGYDDFPNGLSLRSYSDEGDGLIERLFTGLKDGSGISKAGQGAPPNV